MPKISELSNPGSGHSVTGGEMIVVTTQGLSSISLSANDLVNRALDVIDTGTGANLKSTYTSFNANSAEYESAYSTLKSNSAEYESAYSTLKSNSGSYTYVASNSATLQADTTVAGSLSTNDTLIIGGRGTFGSDHIVTDNILTVFGNISAQGTIYASGSALGEVNPVNPGGSNRTIQYNDSNAFGGAAQFAYDETNHNVGIGTQAIAITDNIHEKLTVSGNISSTGTIYYSGGALRAVSPGGADGSVQFSNGGTLSGNANLTFDDTNKRLGIGTSTPLAALHVQSSDISVTPNINADNLVVEENGNAGISIISGTSNTGNLTWGDTTADMASISYSHDTNTMSFRVNSTNDILSIDASGNIGVGTVAGTTTAKLHVNGGTLAVSGANAALEVHNTSGNTLATFSSSHDPSLVLRANQTGFTFENTSGTDILRLNENGNVGIGALQSEPTKELSVLGAISASGAIYGQDLAINHTIPQITLTDTDASGTPYARFQASAGGLEIGADDGNEIAGSTITLQVDNITIATLSGGDSTTVGSFGIGTATPAYKLHVAAPNTSTIAISAFGEIHAGGDIQSSSSSDKRQKKNIKRLENALDKVSTLDGVEYDWNELAAVHRVGKHDVGVIAQQVEEVLPDAVERRENGMMAVRYERLIPLLIESIKELKSEIDELKSK